MQTSKTRNGSSDAPLKTSPNTPKSSRASKKYMSEPDPVISKHTPGKTAAERSPKISPKSSITEKKRLARSTDLDLQLAQLQDELKKTKELLNLSELSKKKLQSESEDVKSQLASFEEKLKESRSQLSEFSAAEDARHQELHRISQERDKAWQSDLEAFQKQHLADSASLGSAVNEIHRLKQHLDMLTKADPSSIGDSESTQLELVSLKEALEAAISNSENLKAEIHNKEMREEETKHAVSVIRKQLETANATITSLRSEGCNLWESFNLATSELEESRARVGALEEMVKELQPLEDVCAPLHPELEHLRAALEATEAKFLEEQIRSTMQIEQVKVDSGLRESELEMEVEKVSRMNKELRDEMDNAKAVAEMKLMKVATDITEQKARLLDKETVLRGLMEENELLRSELGKKDDLHRKNHAAAISDAERARAAERDALARLGIADAEAEKSGKRANLAAEQLEAAQAARSEMETELRRLRVQSDQWRKAAEAAAAVLTPGNNGRRMGSSVDSDEYNSLSGRLMGSPFFNDLDDDASPKRKNGNMLRKFGGLWKKGSK